ncbi:MAG: response regulator transcription factor [Pelosinus sp.]|nr:response regulator transcription factor [Pelosinus sp.]
MPKKILVVDDEQKLIDMIKVFLLKDGYDVITALNGREALRCFEANQPNLIVLDWMMPDVSGLEILKEIRKTSMVPVIMLTAKADEVDKLLGLELGADDYITKPFSLRELSARIKIPLRRVYGSDFGANAETAGSIKFDIKSRSVWVKGVPVTNLTPTEFKILAFLIRHPGQVFSRLQLMDGALGEAYEGYERSLDTHMSNLRKKIEQNPNEPEYIQTIYGVGYKFLLGGS